MRNKTLLKRAKAYAESTEGVFKVRYTENPFDAVGNDTWWGCKYFFEFVDAHNIAQAFRTQAELSDFLTERGF